MATQTIQFKAFSVTDSGGSLTAILLDGSDTALTSVTESATKGTYTGTVTDIAAGDYEMQVSYGGALVATRWVRLVLATGTFEAWSLEVFKLIDVKSVIDSILVDTGTTLPASISGSDGSVQLTRIEAQTSAIVSGQVQSVGPVKPGGAITLHLGSDYRTRAGTALRIPISDIGGAVHTRLIDDTKTDSMFFGAGRCGANEVLGTALIADLEYASDILTIIVEVQASAMEGLEAWDDYTYHIKSISVDSDEYVEASGSLTISDERAQV